jgi:hypothetical protein
MIAKCYWCQFYEAAMSLVGGPKCKRGVTISAVDGINACAFYLLNRATVKAVQEAVQKYVKGSEVRVSQNNTIEYIPLNMLQNLSYAELEKRVLAQMSERQRLMTTHKITIKQGDKNIGEIVNVSANAEEQVKYLERKIANLEMRLATAYQDANRLRGGRTERKRVIQFRTCEGRPFTFVDKNGEHTGKEILMDRGDGEFTHLFVVQCPQRDFRNNDMLLKMLREKYKHVEIIVMAPGTEFTVLEVVR